jgi:hypothetical protein
VLLTPKEFVSERCEPFHCDQNLFATEDRESHRAERPA